MKKSSWNIYCKGFHDRLHGLTEIINCQANKDGIFLLSLTSFALRTILNSQIFGHDIFSSRYQKQLARINPKAGMDYLDLPYTGKNIDQSLISGKYI